MNIKDTLNFINVKKSIFNFQYKKNYLGTYFLNILKL